MNTMYTVFDTETTGFSPKADRIIEIGAARLDPESGEIGETLHFYINPERSVPPESVAIHGLTDEMLADKPKFGEVASEIAAFMKGTIAIAHNAPFDEGFLNVEFKNAGLPKFSDSAKEIVCTRRLARRVRPHLPATLDALCKEFGIDTSARTLHGALIDCELLAKVYPHLARLNDQLDRELSRFLPFELGAALPLDISTLSKGYVSINELIGRLKKENERIRAQVMKLLPPGSKDDIIGTGFQISFGTSTRTNWEKVRSDLLEGKDLSKYTKSVESITIEGN